MAIINSYPIGTPKTNDLLVGTSMPNVNTDADPITKNFSVSDVIALVPYRGTVESVGLSVGGDAVVVSNSPVTSTGILDISWNGDSSQYVNGKGILKTFPDIPFTSLTTNGTSGVSTLVGGVLNVPNYTASGGGTVTSVGLAAPSAFIVSNSPVTGVGTLTLTGSGDSTEYIDGTGALQTFPSIPAVPFTSLTTTGTSGVATLVSGVLNIPNYTTSGGGVTSITAGANIEVNPTVGDVVVSAPDSVENSADVWPSAPKVTQIVTMSQAEYDQGGALNPNWLVIIVQ